MADLEYGPVEVIVVGFEGETPGPGVLGAVAELVEAGTIRVLDLAIVSRSADDVIDIVEIEEANDDLTSLGIELAFAGLEGIEDLELLGEQIPAGSSAVVVVIELLWATKLASRVLEAGGFVISTERIPAPIVNLVVAEAEALAIAEYTEEKE